MSLDARNRARSRTRRDRPLPPAQAAAIRHVRWLVRRIRGLGQAPQALVGRLQRRGEAAEAEAPEALAASQAPRVREPIAPRPRRPSLVTLARPQATRLRALLVAAHRRLGPLFAAIVAGLVGGLGWLARGLVGQRHLLFGLAQRALWWSALALFVVGGRHLLSPYEGTLADALPYFIVGFSLCALAILLAATRRIRWAALALGFGHGALGLLLWTVLYG